MATNPHPKATPDDPRPTSDGPVTAAHISEFLARLRALGPRPDPTERAALLTRKAELFAAIAAQHTHTDPPLARQARQIADHARNTQQRHADNAHAQDKTDVNDLTSPSPPGWGISPSNSGEFRRASSPRG